MDASLPVRSPDGSHLTHTSSGPLNANLGAGEQTNNNQSGGSHNRQFNADVINYQEHQRAETPPLPTHTVPFLRDPTFVARSELSDVQQKLAKPGARVALAGLGGVGKSQLAIECCYRLRERSPDTWVLWIHASSAARFDQDVRNLAHDVKIRGRDDKNADTFELVRGWLIDGRKRWLIVLDNADEADFLFEPPPMTEESGTGSGNAVGRRHRLAYLPVCSHGSVVVTTRHRMVAKRLVDEHDIIKITPTKVHAEALLAAKLGQDGDTLIVQELAAALEYMPLAIVQAVAYIRNAQCSTREYLALFGEGDAKKTELLSEASEEIRRDFKEANNSILISWQISFEHIRRSRKSAADLLSLMSFYDHQGVPMSLLEVDMNMSEKNVVQEVSRHQSRKTMRAMLSGLFTRSGRQQDENNYAEILSKIAGPNDALDHPTYGKGALDADIKVLKDYYFISMKSRNHSLEMHRLVQLATQMWLKGRTQYQWWETQSLRNLDVAFPVGEYENKDICRALFPQIRLVLNLKPKLQDALMSLASVTYKAALFAWSQGLYSEAETAAERSLEIRKNILTENNQDTLASVTMLGSVLRYQGKYEAAEEMNRRALEGREKVLGPEHPSTLTSVSNLAGVLQSQGKYEAAEEMNRRALEGREKVLGPEHPDTLTSVSNLAGALRAQGKYEAAEAMNRRALEAMEKVLGSEHPHTILSVWCLASLHQEQGLYESALALYQRAASGLAKSMGPTHPRTLRCQQELFRLRSKVTRLDKDQ